jgi:hypothetical protein
LYILRRELVRYVYDRQGRRLGEQNPFHHPHERVVGAEIGQQRDKLGFHKRKIRGFEG